MSREKLGYSKDEKIIMFSSSFDRPEKNYKLAKKALDILEEDIMLIEIGKNYKKNELVLFYNACDVFLLTSISEGSPQTIKEAMACNCPIVATDVGDIKEVISETQGCYITSFDPADVSEKLKMALAFGKRTNGRKRIIKSGLDSETIAKKVIAVYKEVIQKK